MSADDVTQKTGWLSRMKSGLARSSEKLTQNLTFLVGGGRIEAEDLEQIEEARLRIFPNSQLSGRANLLAFANLDAANASYNLVRSVTDGVGIGPISCTLAPAATRPASSADSNM